MRFPKSLDLRLTLIFSVVFIVFVGLLLVATHVVLNRSLAQDELRALESRLVSYWSTYRFGGLVGLRRELTAERMLAEERAFMLRIVTPWNSEVFRIVPSSWSKFGIERLSERELPREGQILVLASDSDPYSLLVSGVVLPDGYVLQIGVSNARRVDLLAEYRRTVLLIAAPFVALSLLGGYFVAARSLAPIKALSRITRRIIDTGSLEQRIPTGDSDDELDELATLFNRMLERIAGLVQGIRDSLDNVAHDLRTPITRLLAVSERAFSSAASADEYRVALHSAMEESRRMLAMLSALMDISEAETGTMRLDRSPVDLESLVEDMTELYSYTAEEKGVELRFEKLQPGEPSVQLSVDVNRIRQAVANLLDNAVKYTPPGGRVRVWVEVSNSHGEYSENGSDVAGGRDNATARANEHPPVRGETGGDRPDGAVTGVGGGTNADGVHYGRPDAGGDAGAGADSAKGGRQGADSGADAVAGGVVNRCEGGGWRVGRSRAAGGNGVASIVVEDTGVGIAPGDLPHIWERLFRGDRSRSESGLGLGLATVRAVVSAHGGHVHVSSNPGEGSRFAISLPRTADNITKL